MHCGSAKTWSRETVAAEPVHSPATITTSSVSSTSPFMSLKIGVALYPLITRRQNLATVRSAP
jgi:hypothetical protein